MKTIKQKLLHSKFAVLAVLISAFILLISGAFMSKKVSAEDATFSEANFVMCEGAEARTDGKDGIRFVARLGDALPDTTTYPNAEYYVMIVPKQYVEAYVTDTENPDWYNDIKTALENDGVDGNEFIANMPAKPSREEKVEGDAKKWYIRGTLSSVKYANINVEWFGMAYFTYTDGDGKTQYVYADIPEVTIAGTEEANVRSLVYCASAYLNKPEYAGNTTLEKFVAQGINKAANVAEADKDTTTKLEETKQAIANSASAQVNLLPGKTANWTTGVASEVKLQVNYGTNAETYATYENGVITGVEGDGVKSTTKNVTMKVLGTTYERPVHVYKVTAELPETITLSSKGGTIGDTEFTNSVTLPTAQVDGENLEESFTWENTDTTVATVSEGTVTADDFDKEWFAESKTTTVSYSFVFEDKSFTSNECTVQVSFPIAYEKAPLAYGDLIQQVFNAENTLEQTTEAINTEVLGANFGTVTKFLSEDLSKDLLVDGEQTTNANVYGAKEAGDKNFIVVSADGYAYMVNATVVSYAIGNDTAELDYFFNSYKEDTTQSADGSTYSTKGTYVILSADVVDYTGSPLYALKATAGPWFAGTFDGRGHAIKQAATSTRAMRLGVFSKLTSTAVIKNTAFLGLLKTTAAGGGLAHTSYGLIDNCYVEIGMSVTNAATAAQGGICHTNQGKITNTIVNVTETIQSTAARGTICNTNNGTIKNCFSIGCADIDSIIGSVEKAENDPIVKPVAGDDAATLLQGLIGTALPTSYNSEYWTYNAEAGTLFFGVAGTVQVLINVPEA